jgi:outer membrane protein assembly factor BamA
VFFPIGRRVLLSTAARYDQGFPLGGEVLLPDVERFSAGGDTSVRGFEEDMLKTEIVRTPLDPSGTVQPFRVVPAGGNIRLIHKLDLQLQVWELLAQPVATAIFVDTGIVTNSWKGFELSQLRHSLGIALFRWVTAGGSFSFEYAFPLDPQLGDNPLGQFHLNVGFVF